MASDDANITEDTEMAECDGDKVVTMLDVLQEQQDFEEDANAVLGASDDKNCTYPKGYIKRQALYACLTCCSEAKVDPTKRAGVCLACSLSCHENHELIELYTKRNFRCDCGNPKFNSHPCQFTSDKSELNEDNIYNQNFSGLYCTCQRPYPDPDSTIEDDMIQCIICEDWLHASHLEAVVPANDQYSEMICKNCMEKNEFLHDYSAFAVTVEAGDVDIININGDADKGLSNGGLEKEKLVNSIEENQTEIEPTSVTVNGDVEMDNDKEKSEDKVKDDTDNKENEESVTSETKEDELNPVESTEVKPDEIAEPNNKENEESVTSETKEGELNPVESTEVKPNEIAEPNPDDNKMDLDTENKIAEQEEQSVDTTEVKERKGISEDNSQKSDIIDETTENEDIINEKLESASIEPEKIDEILDDQTETQDRDSKLSTNEQCDTAEENKTDAKENTEQQLLEDVNELTPEKTTSDENTDTVVNELTPEKTTSDENTDTVAKEKVPEEETPVITPEKTTSDENTDTVAKEKVPEEETPVETIEQSKDTMTKDDIETNKEEPPQEMASESRDKTEEKPLIEKESDTSNIDVPDTSQTEKVTKENDEVKTDSVMDVIDELLQTANEAKETKSAEETTSESSENKETTENIETQSEDVEMKASDKVPEKADDSVDSNDKAGPNIEDVSISITSTQNDPINENQLEPTIHSESTEGNSEVKDSINQDNIALKTDDNSLTNITDSELKASNNIDSTNTTENSKDKNEVPIVTENAKENKRKLSTDLTDDISSKKVKLECVRPKNVKRIHKGATFWPSNFRQKLCTCGECLSMYKDLKVLFLTDLEDTVFAYESLGKENVAGGASQYEKGMQALSSLDRIQQINALTEYNRMRDKLLDFLKSFKDRKEIVKEEDIKAFFAGMKPRREPDGVYFCR